MAVADAVPVILTRGLGKVYSAGTEAEVVACAGSTCASIAASSSR